MQHACRSSSLARGGSSITLTRGGSSTTVPQADKPVEMWICHFIPRHVRMYAESFVPRPTCRLGRRVSCN